MPLNINAHTTFSTVVRDANQTGSKENEAIRGRTTKGGATQLYQHGDKPHGADNKLVSNPLSKALGTTLLGKTIGIDPETLQAKKDLRQQKEQQGATWIHRAIDSEYGNGFSARVLQHVAGKRGEYLGQTVLKRDLATIQNSIRDLQQTDRTLNYAQAINPLTQAIATSLVAIATDAAELPAVRDRAANLFQTKMMGLNAQQRAAILNQPEPKLIDALATLRLSNGNRVFSEPNLSTIAQEQFQRETPGEKADTFFRSTSVASRLLARIVPELDGGSIGALGGAMQNIVRQATNPNANLTAPYTAQPSENEPNPKVQAIPNPVVVNGILNQIDGLLHQHLQAAPRNELRAFLTAVATGINNGPPPQGAQTGQDLVKNAIWLRSLAVAVSTTFPNGASPEARLAMAVSAALQKAVRGERYVAGVRNADYNLFYNPGMNTLLNGGSGFNTFQATIP
ncbi:MAG: hypothetical protein V7608_5219 [Hyphomicrobiales bacterium]